MTTYETTDVRMPIQTHSDILKNGGLWSGYPCRYCSEDAVVVTAPDEEEADKLFAWAKLTTLDVGRRVRRY